MAVATSTEKLSNNNLTIVMLLISLLVLGASGLIAKVLVTGIVLDTKVVSAKNKANDQLKVDVNAAPKLVDAYAALGSQTQVLADALPTTADFPGLIVSLENMTKDAGVRLKTVTPVTVPESITGIAPAPVAASITPTPQTYSFSITFDGTYDTLVMLLGHFETSARPMRVVGIQLSGSGRALSGEVDLQTYYQDKGVLPFSNEAIK